MVLVITCTDLKWSSLQTKERIEDLTDIISQLKQLTNDNDYSMDNIDDLIDLFKKYYKKNFPEVYVFPLNNDIISLEWSITDIIIELNLREHSITYEDEKQNKITIGKFNKIGIQKIQKIVKEYTLNE